MDFFRIVVYMEFFVVHAPQRDFSESNAQLPDIISIGELHRCILAKLTQKEIKRAINKYKDLMPKESDWNRKLSESAKNPELGFRYLFRCGQIDDNNNRTLQKMLKYMDRFDILPYFHSLMHQGNVHTASQHPVLRNAIQEFMNKRRQSNDNVLVSPTYEIIRMKCKSSADTGRRTTRSVTRKLRESTGSQSDDGLLNKDRLHRVQSVSKINRKKFQYVPIWNLCESTNVPSSSAASISHTPATDTVAALFGEQSTISSTSGSSSDSFSAATATSSSVKYPVTCDLSMRVRAEYQSVARLLNGRVSHRPDVFSRQLDLFSQSANVLRSHDLGDIMCNIRFSDLYYLEAFWRDYRSGELSKAIKTVFVKDYLTRTNISPEEVHVYIAVDQASYLSGRDLLLKAYQRHYERIDYLLEQQTLHEQTNAGDSHDASDDTYQCAPTCSYSTNCPIDIDDDTTMDVDDFKLFPDDRRWNIDIDADSSTVGPDMFEAAGDQLLSESSVSRVGALPTSPQLYPRALSRSSSASSMLQNIFRTSSFKHNS